MVLQSGWLCITWPIYFWGGGKGRRGGGWGGCCSLIVLTASYKYSTLQSIDYSPHVGIHVASRVPHMQQVMMTSNNIAMTNLHPNCWLQTIGRVALMEQGNVIGPKFTIPRWSSIHSCSSCCSVSRLLFATVTFIIYISHMPSLNSPTTQNSTAAVS